jgi:hypothetical protein
MGSDILRQSASALAFISYLNPTAVHFVHIDVGIRMLLAKILTPEIRIVDADHPVALSRKLSAHAEFQRRIGFSGSEYYARLHVFSSMSGAKHEAVK